MHTRVRYIQRKDITQIIKSKLLYVFNVLNMFKTNGISINFDTVKSGWLNEYLKRLQVIITK